MTGWPEPSVTSNTTGCKIELAAMLCEPPSITITFHSEVSTPIALKTPQSAGDAPIDAQAEPVACAADASGPALTAIVARPLLSDVLCAPLENARPVVVDDHFTGTFATAAPAFERLTSGLSPTCCPAAM